MIKKYILLFFLGMCMFSCHNDELNELMDRPENSTNTESISEKDVVKGRMRIKLKEEPTGKVAVRSAGGKITTGIRALDGSASVIGITHMERTFPYSGKYEERTRRKGLHLWYDVWYSEAVTTTRATGEVAALEGIEIAVPVRKIHSTAVASTSVFTPYGVRSASSSFDDPFLSKQWGFNNLGTEPGQLAGSDIRLFDVWKQYNGDPNIIVAIIDGGIALDNPDLQANLWTNQGEIAGNGIDDDNNGYVDDIHGYNFVSGNATLTPHRHGSHVAGTIAATNNNGMGVCGIAGGNGNPNSGVKLMSCQIFQHPNGNYYGDSGTENTPAAIKYAADNGAVICQNSWGYVGTLDPADKAAIDYFIDYAGCDNDGNQLPNSPMKGGIVLFATNNHNTSNPNDATPADYERVIGVAALGPDYKKAPLSDYGDYIDLCAPGGIEDGPKGIYSTTISQLGFYEYRNGASMACPHVTGVAALIIQKYGVGKQGFTARQLEEILLTTAYNVDSYNPKYIGKLGMGCVDATAALSSTLSESKPFTLTSNPVTNGYLTFRVTMEFSGNASVTLYNGTGSKVLSQSLKVERYTNTSIDIRKLAPGFYTVEYVCNGNKMKEKFIKY